MITFISDLEQYNYYLAENNIIANLQKEIRDINAMPKRQRESVKNTTQLQTLKLELENKEQHFILTPEETKRFIFSSGMCSISAENTYDQIMQNMLISRSSFLSEIRWLGKPLVQIYEEIIAEELHNIVSNNDIVAVISKLTEYRNKLHENILFSVGNLTSQSTSVFANATENAEISAKVGALRNIDQVFRMLDSAIIYTGSVIE